MPLAPMTTGLVVKDMDTGCLSVYLEGSRSLVSYKCEVPERSCLEMQLLSEPKPSEYLEAHLFGSAVPRSYASLSVVPLPFGQTIMYLQYICWFCFTVKQTGAGVLYDWHPFIDSPLLRTSHLFEALIR